MIDREKIIEKLEKEVKRTYAIKTAMYECGKKGYEKISEEITEHREPFVTLTIEMADKILALLKEQEAVKPVRDEKTGRCWLCGNCGMFVGFEDNDDNDPNEFDKFCRECGKPVLWEGRCGNDSN